MRKDMNRLLIETTIRRTLKEINDSPERRIRNLIDLGLNFSSGRFQQNFLSVAQQMLCNENSAYYLLLNNVLANVDPEILTTFGINIGYNSCTRGAKTIRTIEAQRNFNIPWSLSLFINEQKQLESPEFYPEIIRQGTALGIFTYLLFSNGDPLPLISLMKGQPECAFLLFLEGGQITEALVTALQTVKNVMVTISIGENYLFACRQLKSAKILYAAYTMYTEDDRETILNGNWLSSAIKEHPTFAFLLADRSCTNETQKEIYAYVFKVRTSQEHPVFLMDIKHDMLLIDKIISDDVCMAGFGFHGLLLTQNGIQKEAQYNIFQNSLESIFINRMRMDL